MDTIKHNEQSRKDPTNPKIESGHHFDGNYVKPSQKINPDILHVIGNTPLVKLNRIPQSMGLKCDILAKCEHQNSGGSVKDRIAVAMVEDAENRELLKPGFTVIEPNAGNTGIALAMVCAIKGYDCISVLPHHISTEKEYILQALGAKVLRTPPVPMYHRDGMFRVAERLSKTIPNSIILGQCSNPLNPMAHYYGTAKEIFDQCGGQVDMVVLGVGSGGTATGIGRRLKELLPNCLIVAVNPSGAFNTDLSHLNKTEMEGMVDINEFTSAVLDISVLDISITVDDASSFEMARRIHSEEGILCGASSGCLLTGALKAAKQLKEGQKCVVIFPDGIGNYLTKFVSDYWMESKNIIKHADAFNHWWWDYKVAALEIKVPTITISPNMSCEEASTLLTNNGLDLLPCIDDDKCV